MSYVFTWVILLISTFTQVNYYYNSSTSTHSALFPPPQNTNKSNKSFWHSWHFLGIIHSLPQLDSQIIYHPVQHAIQPLGKMLSTKLYLNCLCMKNFVKRQSRSTFKCTNPTGNIIIRILIPDAVIKWHQTMLKSYEGDSGSGLTMTWLGLFFALVLLFICYGCIIHFQKPQKQIYMSY